MSVACLDVEQGLANIIDWEFLAILFSNEHNSLRDCKVNVELLLIFGFGEERRRIEILLELLKTFFAGWSPFEVLRLA